MKSRWVLCLLSVALVPAAFLVSSCGKEEGPNLAPDTTLKTAPSPGSTVPYKVNLEWSGSDPDGWIDFYEVAWFDGIVYEGTLEDLSWERVNRSDSIFAVSADSCPVPPQTGNTCRGSHTFFVRAVDNEGQRDPTPASVGFNATTLLPLTSITSPHGQSFYTMPEDFTIKWDGTDPDGKVVQYRYVAKPYESEPVRQPPDQSSPSWSPWTADTQINIHLNPLDTDVYGPWVFYVQAKDNAGAIENNFSGGRANHIFIEINQALENVPFVEICASTGACNAAGSLVGCRASNNSPAEMDVPIDVAVGDTLCFRADFQPGLYAGKVLHIGFLVNDPGQPAWRNASDADNTFYPGPNGSFTVQPNIFTIYVSVEDDLHGTYGSVATAFIKINGVPGK
jgi:hypothetical protein